MIFCAIEEGFWGRLGGLLGFLLMMAVFVAALFGLFAVIIYLGEKGVFDIMAISGVIGTPLAMVGYWLFTGSTAAFETIAVIGIATTALGMFLAFYSN